MIFTNIKTDIQTDIIEYTSANVLTDAIQNNSP